MRILVISDVHGNSVALDAVLADAAGVDATICLGDLTGYGPNPNEVVETVRALAPVGCLVGNHDLACLGTVSTDLFNGDAARAARWTAARLTDSNRSWLSSLTPDGSVSGVHLSHGSPRDPIWEYLDSSEQGPANFDAFQGPTCFVGHTHVPLALEQGGAKRFTPLHMLEAGSRIEIGGYVRMIVNPGSVGQPRDGDWRASYGLWDPEAGTFELHRVEYDVEETQRRILDAGLPPFLAYRLTLGR